VERQRSWFPFVLSHRSGDRADLVGDVAVDVQALDRVPRIEHVGRRECLGFHRLDRVPSSDVDGSRDHVDRVLGVDLHHRLQILAHRGRDVVVPGP
jgi:hypothetical protein